MKVEFSERAHAPVEVGQKVPDLALWKRDGREVRLSDLRGRPVLLAFSSEWDPAWPRQVKQFESLAKGLEGAEQFTEIISDGSCCRVQFSRSQSIEIPIVHRRPTEDTAAAFGVEGQALFVIDAKGVVRWRYIPGDVGERNSYDRKEFAADGLSRRQFLATAVAASLALALVPRLTYAKRADSLEGQTGTGERTISLNINGTARRVKVDPRTSLLDALRERLGMMGTKKGCDHGQCGACTVHIGGRRVNSCLALAMQAEGSKITTIEGLSRGGRLHPVQETFIEHDGFQCGYCTPGQIMSAVACIEEGHTGSEEEIKEWMSGNICRCGAYPGICAAIAEAKNRMNS